jgi:hypothetical protein
MDCFAVVAQCQLCEAFGTTGNLRPFRPGVTVAVQCDAFDAQADTALFEFGRPVAGAHGLEIWKQRAGFRQGRQNIFDFLAKPNLRRLLSAPASLHPHKANEPHRDYRMVHAVLQEIHRGAVAKIFEARSLYEQWPKRDVDRKRAILESIFEKVEIGEGKINITYSGLPYSEALRQSQQQMAPATGDGHISPNTTCNVYMLWSRQVCRA